MPIYTYKCTKCDHRFEARQRFSDDPISECPVCGSPVRKVITPVGIVFKGSGFYVTDNKNGKASSTLNGTSPASKASESESTAKNDKSTPTAASKSSSTSESAGAASAA
ncbi:MAG: FmdB family zinc ribbon protein [Candidatus Promineifilaceae bacterium]|jgi:putative FmdB family regulatory protein